MPLLKLETTEHFSEQEKHALCARLSRICAETIGKPEGYVMVSITEGAAMLHGGKPGPAAFVEVRGIGGLGGKVNGALSQKICQALQELADVPGERVYLNFMDVAASDWGHDGSTFG